MTTAATEDYRSDEARWNAVRSRDPAADGSFCYSVKTTGVFCVPSCPSRPAKRENIAFHASAAAALEAGFRACKRCSPGEPPLHLRQAAAIAMACRKIEAAGESPSLDEIALAAGISRFHFHRLFKKFTGLTPKAFASACRARRVRGLLPESATATVTEAIYAAGFESNSRFYAQSSALLGMKPKPFRHGGRGESIRFAIGESSLGPVLVAATLKGVCAVFMGDNPDDLAADLQRRFPNAELTGGDAEFDLLVARVIGLVEAPRLGWDLPLDLRGTAFQQRVWQALREIPAGSTDSYTGIADRIGLPKAVRAVAGACAANPVAVAVPCHRVVRVDGGLSGYRWGVERKRELLDRESKA